MRLPMPTPACSAVLLATSIVGCLFPASLTFSHETGGGEADSIGTSVRSAGTKAVEPSSVTLPFTMDHNRMIVEVEFVRTDGTTCPARAWVDTGNEVLLLSKPLARDLGIDVSDVKDEGLRVELPTPAPVLRMGGMSVKTEGIETQVLPGDLVWHGVPADFNLPVSLLKHEHVILDYPARRLTVARPGVIKPKGGAVPCRVNAETGLFMVAAVIDGDTIQLGVDNGSAGTWVSDSLTTRWKVRHPNWPQATGAAGSANFFGFPFESEGVLMRLPEVEIGAVRAQEVGLLGLDQSFFDWYSKKSAGSVLGFIGSNILRNLRLEVDFPSQMTYWTAGPKEDSKDLDIVGLTIRPEGGGGFAIAAVVSKDGKPTVEGARPGDRLISVDGRDVSKSTMGAVVDALRGRPGTQRAIVLERDGKRFTIAAEVRRLP